MQLIIDVETFTIIRQLPTPDLFRMNASIYFRPSLVPGNATYRLLDGYVFIIEFLFVALALLDIFLDDNRISLSRVVVFVLPSGIPNPPIICDKANHGLVSNSALLISRKPSALPPFVTELIVCTCSTPLELSFRIIVSR